MQHVLAPTRPRLAGLDAARGLAVLGMFAAHVGAADRLFDWTDPSSWPDLVNGRSSVLFALCAGVSLVLLTTGPRADPGTAGGAPTGRPRGGLLRDRRHVLARAAVLLAIGALLTLVPGGVLVILPTYAVLFVAALPFLRLRLRWVVLATALSLGVGPVLALVGQAVVEMSGNGIADLLFVGYPAVSWFGVVLAGVLVARLGLDRAALLRRMLVVGTAMAVVGYGGGALLGSALGVVGPVGMLVPVTSGGGAGRCRRPCRAAAPTWCSSDRSSRRSRRSSGRGCSTSRRTRGRRSSSSERSGSRWPSSPYSASSPSGSRRSSCRCARSVALALAIACNCPRCTSRAARGPVGSTGAARGPDPLRVPGARRSPAGDRLTAPY